MTKDELLKAIIDCNTSQEVFNELERRLVEVNKQLEKKKLDYLKMLEKHRYDVYYY